MRKRHLIWLVTSIPMLIACSETPKTQEAAVVLAEVQTPAVLPLNVACSSPPADHCASGDCAEKIAKPGNVIDKDTGRTFFLDYPCDWQAGDPVVFILNIHGAGSIANWQRHYFPAIDYKEKYHLVVATPSASGSRSMGGGPPVRVWTQEDDDAHLENIVNSVIEAFGAENIQSFWLAGHSQGGMTSRRLVCTPFYRDKVDGMLSLSGGRIGNAQIVPAFGPPLPDGSPPPPRERLFAEPALPDCDFSHIYTTGEHEIVTLPETSPWAAHFNCAARMREADITDTSPGWVTDSARQGYKVWGMAARPGVAEVFRYPDCADGYVVADVVRIDKGHTEGLEPKVTEYIVRLMAGARGGKLGSLSE